MELMIAINNLSFNIGANKVLDNISFVLNGKIGLVGKNGSGKTTLINTILGKIEPLNGNVIVGSAVKLGIISQDTININSKCTVIEYLTNKKDNIDLSLIFILLDKFGKNCFR